MIQAPVFRRQASSGADHRRDVQTQPKRDGDGIPVYPRYKSSYIPEHDISRRYWVGGRKK